MFLSKLHISRIFNYLGIALYCCFRLLLAGPAPCKFYPTCGPYALQQLKHRPFLPALKAICIRVWHCSPWGSQHLIN